MKTPHEQLKLVVDNGQPKNKRTTFPERKAVGDPHEVRVAERLTKEGWSVDRYGVERFRPEIVEALGRTENCERWRPDFIAVRGLDIVYIDAKAAMESGSTGRRRFVNAACVKHQMNLYTLGLHRIYYVFDGFEVSTPNDVFERGNLEKEAHSPIGSGGAYYSIEIERCRSFDQLFGAPRLRPALRAVA
jgi:hypothetical protein